MRLKKGTSVGVVDPEGIGGGNSSFLPGNGTSPKLIGYSVLGQPGGFGDSIGGQGQCHGGRELQKHNEVLVNIGNDSDPEDERGHEIPLSVGQGRGQDTEGRAPVEFAVQIPTAPVNPEEFGDESFERRDKINWSNCQAKLVVFALVWNAFNLFRFPDAVYRNGGGSLMFAYLLIMVFVMQPLVFFELLLGQLYLRKNSHRGVNEGHVFSFVASGIGAGTFLTGLFFLPNQLISMNYASLYTSEIFHQPIDQESCTCNEEFINERPLERTCIPLKGLLNSVGTGMSNLVNDFNSSGLQQGFLSCESHYKTNILINPNIEKELFMDTLNWRLVFPALIGMVIVFLLALKKFPNNAAKVMAWISLLIPLTVFSVLGYQITYHGWQQGIFDFMDVRLDINIFAHIDIKMWSEAIKLGFITSGVGFGILPVIASSNPRRFPQLYRTSWMYVISVCLVCLLSTLNAFMELGILSDILGKKDLRKIVQETTHLSLITFCSFICKNSQIFRCFGNCFFALVFLTSCWVKSCVCQGIIDPTVRLRSSRRIILPCIMFFLEAIYILPEARILLEDTGFFGGAWTSCSITMIRVVAFVTAFGVGRLQSHVRELIHHTLPGFFVVQIKYLMTPLLMGMFLLLCPTIVDAFPIKFFDLSTIYPEWLKIYGMILNVLPLVVLLACCTHDLIYKPRDESSGFPYNQPLNKLPMLPPTSILKRRTLSITNLSTNSAEHDVISRPKPAFTSFARSEGDAHPTGNVTEISLRGLDLDGYIERITKASREQQEQEQPLHLHYAESLITQNPNTIMDNHTGALLGQIGEAGDSAGIGRGTEEDLLERLTAQAVCERENRSYEFQNMSPEVHHFKIREALLCQNDHGSENGYSEIGGEGDHGDQDAEDLDKTFVIDERDWPPPPFGTPRTLPSTPPRTPPTPPPRPSNRPRSKLSDTKSFSSKSSGKSEETRKVLSTLDEVLENFGDSSSQKDYEYEEVGGGMSGTGTGTSNTNSKYY